MEIENTIEKITKKGASQVQGLVGKVDIQDISIGVFPNQLIQDKQKTYDVISWETKYNLGMRREDHITIMPIGGEQISYTH